MNKYQRGKIYKIVSDLTDDVYIGSTTEPTLARRLAKHRGCYKGFLNGTYHYVSSFKVLQTGNYDIVLLENYPCNSKDELHKKEREYIENTPNVVNKIIPTRTKFETDRAYREANKEAIREKKKQYREANKEAIREKKKQYREANKEAIREKQAMKMMCECGSEHRIYDKERHSRTEKHQNYIKSLTE